MMNEPQQVRFANADGHVLHGDLVWPQGADLAVVIAHPHPQFGGNRYNNVVGALFTTLAQAGVAALRFDFRGVGSSEGAFDDGEGEARDIAAALDHLEAAAEQAAAGGGEVRLAVAGYSFGADVSLGLEDPRPCSFLAVAPPLQIGGADRFTERSDPRPVRILSGTNDQFRTAEAAAGIIDKWSEATVHPVEGVDHFFSTGLDQVAAEASAWAESLR